MKTLIIFRHGKAESYDAKPNDYDRELAGRGRLNAGEMGKFIFKKYGKPGLVLASSARRTLQTATLAAEEMEYPITEIKTDENLYLPSERRIMKIIRSPPDDCESCLLVGHNPGLTNLINQLNVRLDNLPTGSAVCFNFNTGKWSEISADNSQFQWLQLAREL